VEKKSTETLMTEYSEELSLVVSRNGRRSYFFETPLLEGYTLAREPYREFRKGIDITTYQDDSLTTPDVTLTANYAIYYVNRDLWEAKGDVVVEKADGKTLYTQQLFWNGKTGKIYSNVDTRIVEKGADNVFQGEGFESDEAFRKWSFRRFTGKMDVDVSQEDRPGDPKGESGDSVSHAMPRTTLEPVRDDPRPSAAGPVAPAVTSAPGRRSVRATDTRTQDRRSEKTPIDRPSLPQTESATVSAEESSADALPVDETGLSSPKKKRAKPARVKP